MVLLFMASDCPISNRYVPDVAGLQREFGAQRVRFWWVFPNEQDTAAVVRSRLTTLQNEPDVVLDMRQTVTRMAHATITPEAAIFVPQGNDLREVYLGRIDDRYVSLGSERPQARHHDLENALAAVLEGRPSPPPGGPPVGCTIVKLQ